MARGRRATRAAWKAVLESKQAGRGAHHAASVHVRRTSVLRDTIDVMHKFGRDLWTAHFLGSVFLERCDFSMLQRSATARKRLKMHFGPYRKIE